ncbi:hypothetical protein Q4491_07350 [Photobacterium sp. 2_MG-2023]|uniref:DUF6916 family protein n=1 Tax=unclassified Photobacterium TaxID=2628852 RepID=UPI001C4471C7|nr:MULTISPECIES: hypothetical protein [unclassified Photobacterium]MBV7261751.1 hypothetical protein [Photobacterium sp. WH24]MDO6581163.1 hypothetical protein [Photobacterium sp. 2_MG-2023]
MEQFTFEKLEKLVGDKMSMTLDKGASCEVEITGVKRTGTHSNTWESFALYLDCSGLNGAVEQGTYLFGHESLGEAPLFVSPNSAKELEVIFSRKVTHS